jgi:hypothetical protein
MAIVYTVLKLIGGVAIIALWGYGLYLRGGYRGRDHKAGVRTLFSGEK